MSNIGKQYIKIPNQIKLGINIKSNILYVEGKYGILNKKIPSSIKLIFNSNLRILQIIPKNGQKNGNSAIWGVTRTIIYNMIKGVNQGFLKRLIFIGIGYKAKIDNNLLILKLGFSHLISYKIPSNIKINILKPNLISIFGNDISYINNISSLIRSLKKPEPYKGKGIRYIGENIRRKEGKTQ